ncbi:MAG: hypothetical protein WKG01_02980 [Kofleriaceae bacterium]
MRVAALLVPGLVMIACGSKSTIEPSATTPLPEHHDFSLDTSRKSARRMVPPEAFLRGYLVWFGNLAPDELRLKARGWNLFDNWDDYLAALGLPNYKLDVPRATQSNTMMLATIGRLGEALCMRAAEHDLRGRRPISERRIFAFEPKAKATLDEFQPGFDVLHRTFLGYPAALAPSDRRERFFELYQRVASRHPDRGRLDADQMAWAAICSALVVHPETELY